MPKPKRSGTGRARPRPAARSTGAAAGPTGAAAGPTGAVAGPTGAVVRSADAAAGSTGAAAQSADAADEPAGTGPVDPAQRLAGRLLHAARDIGRVETAFDAELLLSTLLGSVYAAALPDRGGAVESLVAALRSHPELTDVVSRVLAALTEAQPSAGSVGGADEPAPAWVGELGRVRVTGAYAYGDRYGDQTTYLTTFEYENPTLGGPDHAVAILVDHNLGLVKDLLVASPAGRALEQIRASVSTDPDGMTWFAEIGAGAVRAAAAAYLRATDVAADLPDEESLPANRALVLARLEGLPALQPSTTDSTSDDPADFLASPDAQLAGLADLEGADRDSVTYCLGLIVDFGRQRGGDPLRWSPRSAELFLLDWVHQRAVLDADDQRLLPDVLGAWVSWAGRRLDLPIPAINETIAAVRRLRGEFARLCASGERRSPAARAMAELLAAGVDPGDSAALDAWIRDNL
jgi:hypothetical protein